MRSVAGCRTPALGGHVQQCDACGHEHDFYHSCCNRHCPKCQSLTRERWLQDRKAELLPVQYFHVVFTVPDTIAAVALQNRQVVYDILFRTAGRTLRKIAADPQHLGAEIGFLAVLHTWNQKLHHHPHVHVVVPGGGLSPDGSCWVSAREDFFLSVRVLSSLFRGLFLHALRKAFTTGRLSFFGDFEYLAAPQAFSAWLNRHRKKDWVVYCKRPFAGPLQVLEYLGRYTHRVAISNSRLLDVDDKAVTFRYRDNRRDDEDRYQTMSLDSLEFIRRFLLHVLPSGFVRIRYGGFFGNRHRHVKLTRCRELLNVPPPAEDNATDWKTLLERITGSPIDLCPVCKVGRMVAVEPLDRQPLPRGWPLVVNLDSS